MENKINVAELLKDCPIGMELDCAMYNNLYFEACQSDYYDTTIRCYTLIGGIKIEAAGQVLDSTVLSALDNLKNSLKKGW